MERSVKVGLVQNSCTGKRDIDVSKAIEGIRKAAEAGARIICTQELFASLYFCNTEDYDNFNLAEPVPGPMTEQFSALAKELDVVIIASLFEKRAEGIYHNTAAVIDADGSLLGIYRKNHIPDDPGYYEKFYFVPGDTGYKVFPTKYAKVGVLICWDQWYPEAARITSLMGAEILFYPTAIGWSETQSEEVNKEQFNAWQTIQRSHAVANGVYVVSVNRNGMEHGMKFWGGSFVSNPFGSVITQAPHDEDSVLSVELDLSKINHYRTHWPFLRDRRIDTYSPVTNRFID